MIMLLRVFTLLLFPSLVLAQPTAPRDLVVESTALLLTEKRHALIIGNDRYPKAPLLNAGNDARSIEQALSELGFETMLLENAVLEELDRGVKKFLSRIRQNDVALVFYAGHGFQIEGENYIVPVDFSAEDISAAKFSSYPANKLLDGITSRDPKLQLIILDACRNNPFAVSRNVGGGLAMMGASGKGTFIALATAPGSTASDNPNGVNGLFTTALLKSIKKKGLALTELFDEVKREVSVMSADAQRPWTNSDFAGKWYFLPPEDFVPEEVDPATSLRLLEEARKNEKNLFYEDAAGIYDRLAVREKDSEIGKLAKSESVFLRALVAAKPSADANANVADLAAQLQGVWELLPSRAAVGLESSNNYLVAGMLPQAIGILSRLRGADQDIAFRSTEMLQELAHTFPQAAEVLAAPFKTLPVDPMVAKPTSRFEGMAEKLKQASELKRKSAALESQSLVPLSGVISSLPPPSTEGWLLRLETLKSTPPKETAPPTVPTALTTPEAKPLPKKPSNLILVEFQSKPPGALVSAGEKGVLNCQTPCTLDLPPGNQSVTLALEGHRIASRTWEVSKSQALVAIELDLQQGNVTLATTPAQAQVELDGKLLSNHTPTNLALAPGDYAVSFWDGKIRVKQLQKFSLKDGETVPVTIKSQ